MANSPTRLSLLNGIETNQQFVAHHVYCIWLFTRSDLITMLLPKSSFGILTALSCTDLQNDSGRINTLTTYQIWSRAPLVFLWVWAHLLAFNIGNQRRPESIAEDAVNKPWRTMPSGKWTHQQAYYAWIMAYLGGLLLSLLFQGLVPSLALLILGHWYNDRGGGDVNALVRNLINALGYVAFATGALEVALNRPVILPLDSVAEVHSHKLRSWMLLLFCSVFTTVHTQDMHDQQGDATRGRFSVPLQIGDAPARWLIMTFVLCWGLVCPCFWNAGWTGYITTTPLALATAYRTMMLRTARDDSWTFVIWNLWIMSLYSLPLQSRMT
ncbi:UbiA prenyltransferase family [Astrocystis sublimbata]|nr:UbiA prenyltransferase family [Astrocystis sublimbata]